jgi:hypothetical protein
MPEKRKYSKPVAWLGGRDLLANLKYFLLFAAFKGKLDPRDWMKAEVFPAKPENTREEEYVDAFNKSFRSDRGLAKEFWFDYFADSGDGMTAGYAIAYLCMTDLRAKLSPGWTKLSAEAKKTAIHGASAVGEIRSRFVAMAIKKARHPTWSRLFGDSRRRILNDYADRLSPETMNELRAKNDEDIIKHIEERAVGVITVPPFKEPSASDSLVLPRGAFLFVGGDTAYHVADFAGMAFRFQKVFDWAFQDLTSHLSEADAREMWQESNRRPIFAVPGNHDYYDMIDGFNRQFGRPMTRETNFINLAGRDMPPQLRLWAFKRFQTSSYAAIQLPFGWWFWGVDSELPRVDLRQQEFFKRAYSSHDPDAARKQVIDFLTKELGQPPTPEQVKERFPRLARYPLGDRWPTPRKLIVATSEPTTVEGRREPPDDKTPQAFCFLDLTRPFAYPGGPKDLKSEIRKHEEKLKLVDFECRLDISGDVHHYARYWGDESVGNYASVVSGGGGASMSPTQTDYQQVPAQTLYPEKEASTRRVNQELLKPWTVISGGNVWLAGLVIAMIFIFGASFPESHFHFTRSIISTFGSARNLVRPLGIAGAAWEVIKGLYLLFVNAGGARIVKLLLLTGVSIWSFAAAGLYARWLFERLTKTHDWAVDKLRNLSLAKGEEKKALEEIPTKEDYEKFLEQIEGQINLPEARGRRFVRQFIACIIAGLVLWAIELFSHSPWKPIYCLAALIAIVVLIFYIYQSAQRRFQNLKADLSIESKHSNAEKLKIAKQCSVTTFKDYLPFWGLVGATGFGTLVLAAVKYHSIRETLPLFGTSAMILFSILASITCALVAMYYSKWLFDQSYRIKVNNYSYGPSITVSVISVLILVAAFALFGRNQVRFVVMDILYLTALLAVPIGCIALAVLVGNHLRTFGRTIGFLVLGAWHGLLQLLVPFMMVWVASAGGLFIALALVVVVTAISLLAVTRRRLNKINSIINGKILVTAWFVYGFLTLLVSTYWHSPLPTQPYSLGRVLTLCALGAVVGALMSCVWLGWYFAVALVFNGHANEAGSTARTEHYKHFIRFRVTDKELTGYVIGVDFPHAPLDGEKPRYDGSTLKPRLIDVFTLKCD